jgi:hypothetical protein
MSQLPPLYRDQRLIDAAHLKWLAIGHFVGAGLALLGLLFVFGHYVLMQTFFADPQMWKNSKSGPPPAAFMAVVQIFYVISGLLYVTSATLNLLSGLFMQARRHRIFSLIVAGTNCFHMPLGTILGIFTFVVLLRDSVRQLYDAQPGPTEHS